MAANPHFARFHHCPTHLPTLTTTPMQTTLGLTYSLVLGEALLSPAIPSVAARTTTTPPAAAAAAAARTWSASCTCNATITLSAGSTCGVTHIGSSCGTAESWSAAAARIST